MRSLVIGGIEIPIRAAHLLVQNYDPVQSVARFRMAAGNLEQQRAWAGKLNTQINGDGVIPAGIQSLDYSQPITIKSIAERTVTSASNVITVPAARRVDYGVEGRALVDDVWQNTPVSMVVNVATLTVVASATQYQAIYWPELVCYCNPPPETRNARTNDYGWSLTAEEI